MANNNNAALSAILCLPVDEKGVVSEADRDEFFKRTRSKNENRICFDCSARNNAWLSTTYGIFLCMNCSSNHRRMGTHVSFVRSSDLDMFTRDQLVRIELGGNMRARCFFKDHGLMDGKPVDYHGRLAQKYRQTLEKDTVAALGKLSSTGLSSLPSISLEENSQRRASTASWGSEGFERIVTPTTTTPTQCNGERLKNCVSDPKIDETPKQTANRPPTPGASTLTAAPSSRGTVGFSTSVPPSSSAVKGKKLEFDFDFDAVEKAGAFQDVLNATNEVTPAASTQQSTVGALRVQASPPGTRTNDTSRFVNAKAISSSDYFASKTETSAKERHELDTKIAKFDNARAISSAAFFSGDPNCDSREAAERSRGVEDEATEQIAQLKEQAREGIATFARNAEQAMASARDWFSQFDV